MNLKNLLLALGLCVGADAHAQVGTNSLSPLSAEIKPRLHAVENSLLPADARTGSCRDARTTAVPEPCKAQAWHAPGGKEASGKEKLDSIVAFNPDGSKQVLQRFFYDSNGKEVSRRIHYWVYSSASWGDPVEAYDYVWSDDGLVLSEQFVGYGSGARNEYRYDDRGLGIEQLTYQLDADGEWVEKSKGVYGYDDNGNIVEEMIYVWDGSQWVNSVHNFASWDARNRQTGFTGYAWDGVRWTGTGKGDYVWFDGPCDPDWVEGTAKERMTYKADYFYIGGEYKPFYIMTNEFQADGRLAGQSEKFYDRQNKKWCGGDNWDGRLATCMTWKSRMTYDEHGAPILSEIWKCLPDSAGWLALGASPTEWTYDEAGNREGLYKLISYVYDERNNKIGETFTQQTHYGYNADNKRTWVREELVAEDGTTETLFEEKYGYDDAGLHIYTYVWDWVDGERKCSSRTSFSYDSDGNLTESISYGGGGDMEPLGLPVMRAAGITPEDNEGWVNSARWTYEYEKGVLVDKRGYVWRDEQWFTNTGQAVSYDFDVTSSDACFPEGWSDPYKINTIDDLSSDGENGWMATTRKYYYSGLDATGIGGLRAEGAEGVSIKHDGDMLYVTAPDNVSIDIFNVSGAHVGKVCGTAVYVGDLPSGVYVVAVDGYRTKIVKR